MGTKSKAVGWFAEIAETSTRACAVLELDRKTGAIRELYINRIWENSTVHDGICVHTGSRAFFTWAENCIVNSGIADLCCDDGTVFSAMPIYEDCIGIMVEAVGFPVEDVSSDLHKDAEWQLRNLKVDVAAMHVTAEEFGFIFDKRRIIRELLGQYGIVVSRYDPKTKVMHVSQSQAHIIGMDSVLENVPESSIHNGTVMPSSVGAYLEFFEKIQRGDANGRAIVQRVREGYAPRWLEMQFSNIFDTNGEILITIIRYIDKTDDRERELAYARRRSFKAMLDARDLLALDCDLYSNCVEEIMGKCAEMFEAGMNYDIAVGLCVEMCANENDRSDLAEFLSREKICYSYYQGMRHREIEIQLIDMNGDAKWVNCVTDLIADPYSGAPRVFVQMLNIDERKQQELELKAMSEHDPLTGAYNRRAFINRFAEICDASEDSRHAFLMIDMDNFRDVNDTLGHVRGDQVLSDVANKLQDTVGENGIVGRIGGDEFAVLLANMRRTKEIIAAAEGICAALSYDMNGVRVSASIGIAMYPRHGDTFGELYERADAALYRAKGLGRDRFVIYKDEEDAARIRKN